MKKIIFFFVLILFLSSCGRKYGDVSNVPEEAWGPPGSYDDQVAPDGNVIEKTIYYKSATPSKSKIITTRTGGMNEKRHVRGTIIYRIPATHHYYHTSNPHWTIRKQKILRADQSRNLWWSTTKRKYR